MVSLVYGLANAANHGWTSVGTLGPLAAAAVLLVGFGVIETRSAAPLMPLRIFANRNRSGAYAMMLCLATAVFSMFFFLTQFLQNILGWSPIKTGVGFLPVTGGVILAAAVTARLVGRIGIRGPLLAGPAAMTIGLAWLSRLTVTSSYPGILGPLILIALGAGSQFVPLTLTAVHGVRPTETGLASALLNTAQQLGGAFGLSVLATVAIDATRSRLRALITTHSHAAQLARSIATTHGYTSAFEVAAGIALVGFVISLTVIRAPRRPAAATGQNATASTIAIPAA
jgi:predicted MFS family arabinose efflux permease